MTQMGFSENLIHIPFRHLTSIGLVESNLQFGTESFVDQPMEFFGCQSRNDSLSMRSLNWAADIILNHLPIFFRKLWIHIGCPQAINRKSKSGIDERL